MFYQIDQKLDNMSLHPLEALVMIRLLLQSTEGFLIYGK